MAPPLRSIIGILLTLGGIATLNIGILLTIYQHYHDPSLHFASYTAFVAGPLITAGLILIIRPLIRALYQGKARIDGGHLIIETDDPQVKEGGD